MFTSHFISCASFVSVVDTGALQLRRLLQLFFSSLSLGFTILDNKMINTRIRLLTVINFFFSLSENYILFRSFNDVETY